MKSGGPASEEREGEGRGAGLRSSRTVLRPSPLVKLSLVKLSLAPRAWANSLKLANNVLLCIFFPLSSEKTPVRNVNCGFLH